VLKLPEGIPLDSSAINKALARFQVDQRSEVRPIEVRWRLPGTTLSSLDLSIVDTTQSGISFNQISRQTTSGKYLASPVVM
jgi:hypothetical protein